MDILIWGDRISALLHLLPNQSRGLLKEKDLKTIVEKGENAGNQHFLLFPTMFSSFSKTGSIRET